jgi:recombination protein RecA
MAKKNKIEEPEEVDVQQETDVVKLSKLLIKSFNKDEEKTGKIAWNLDSDLDNPTDVKEFISTGNTLLDYCIANKKGGGVPVGKLTEIVGEEASGKSLLCAHLAANCQKKGGVVAYIDTENAMMPEFAKQIGVDLKKMIYLQPGTVEEVDDAIVKMILMTRQKAPNQLVLIIWDSIAGTPTKVEIEGDLDLNMNQQLEKAKVLSKMMRRITQTLGKERICLVFTNQLKTKIGVMYGDPMTTPGGKAVPYHASVRIRLNRRGTEKDGGDGDVTGVNTAAKLIKNRLGPPLRKCHFFISFAHGIEDAESWFELLHEKGEIEKRSGFCYVPSYNAKFSFRESQWVEKLKEVPEFKKWAEDKLNEHMIVRYGEKPDPESLMEVEQTVADVLDE